MYGDYPSIGHNQRQIESQKYIGPPGTSKSLEINNPPAALNAFITVSDLAPPGYNVSPVEPVKNLEAAALGVQPTASIGPRNYNKKIPYKEPITAAVGRDLQSRQIPLTEQQKTFELKQNDMFNHNIAAIETTNPVLSIESSRNLEGDTTKKNRFPILSIEQQLQSIVLLDVSPQIEDEWMEQICKIACGGSGFQGWWRAQKPRGKARSWGLAMMNNTGAVSRFIKAIEGLELPSFLEDSSSYHSKIREIDRYSKDTNPRQMKAIRLLVDNRTHRLIEEWIRQNNCDSEKDEQIKEDTVARLASLITTMCLPDNLEAMRRPKMEEKFKHEIPDPTEETLIKVDDGSVGVPEDDAMALIYKEIRLFRERSAKRDRANKLAEDNYERIRAEFEKHRPLKEAKPAFNLRRLTREEKELLYSNENEDEGSSDTDDGLSDKAYESKSRESHKANLEKKYLEHERRWLSREKSRASAIEREIKCDKEGEENMEQKKKEMYDKLARWTENDENRRNEKYYNDRSRWLKFLSHEQELDHRDRIREREELQADQTSFKLRSDKSNKSSSTYNDQYSKIISSFSLDLKPASKTHNKNNAPTLALSAAEKFLDEDENNEDRTSFLEKIKQSENEAKDMTDLAKINEEKVRNIANSLPVDKDGIFSYPIKWEELNKPNIEYKVRIFVTRKTIEYIGVQDDDMINFVCDHVFAHKSAHNLVEELFGALDEDAETFILMLYRYLAIITESSSILD